MTERESSHVVLPDPTFAEGRLNLITLMAGAASIVVFAHLTAPDANAAN